MLFLAAGVLIISIGLDTYMYGAMSGLPNSVRNVLDLMSALFSLLTVLISMSHVRETEAERQASVAVQLLHAERSRYAQEKNIHDIINIKCHDIRHQIAAMGPAGYEKEIRKIGKLVDIYDATPRTQCVALDVALSSKMLACQSQNITLTCMADGRSLGFMDDSDIYALFGNILDNAIEATSKISDPDKRQISLTVSDREGFLLIEAENFFSGKVTFEQGLPVTTKTDRDFHGFGTRSIQILTEKYGGDLKMTVEDGIFRLSIMLPVAAAA
jgi:signal transduction histidine kinase